MAKFVPRALNARKILVDVVISCTSDVKYCLPMCSTARTVRAAADKMGAGAQICQTMAPPVCAAKRFEIKTYAAALGVFM